MVTVNKKALKALETAPARANEEITGVRVEDEPDAEAGEKLTREVVDTLSNDFHRNILKK